ncbi:helix-turn-helix transcriptional regulator [Actinoplanes sp. NEAU-A12]|uniref:Helix-turn-helix transcriptional regulator n=1 Tax=Actinoplanes sandaracinus TaxID=3045177 RepID=A0ABT6WIC0_9ACTN|nr:helix-turn-helix transcriptional regulator [Actinoplanes sandaracinus]MDI6099482.1 helix-turn-helix transcriptional regulator [Actinoplanes sandaracinus]
MDNRVEVREFLTSRRARISPDGAGLPAPSGRRRVPGLRRSEVAALAGVSVEYYAKLERGSLAGVSAGVLDAIARALRLDDAERAHLLRLAHEADGSNAILRPRRRAKPWALRPTLRWSLDAITTAPAIVTNNRGDLLAANPMGRAMFHDHFADPAGPNFARFAFLDAAARRFYPHWDVSADIIVANLRTSAGKDPHDKSLHDLVGELSTRSDAFRRRWAAHNVRTHGTGVKQFHHHVVGDLTLSYESMDLRAEPDLSLTVYAAEPGSSTADALRLLASWAATSVTAV